MSGSFSAALAALKAGEVVRRDSWRDVCVTLEGRKCIPTASLPTESPLRVALTEAKMLALNDWGCLIKLDMTAASVTRGWLPTAEDLLAEDWGIYLEADIKALKMEWELTDAISGPGDVSQESLIRIITEQLGALGVTFTGVFNPSAESSTLELLLDEPYQVTIGVRDGGYYYRDSKTGDEREGTGRLRAELRNTLDPAKDDKRKFHHTIFSIEVLSDLPIPGDMSMEDVLSEINNDNYAGVVKEEASHEISAELVPRSLQRLGLDPEFFAHTEDPQDEES
jgi:hypothetical protein